MAIEKRTCPECGAEYYGTASSKYCGAKCRHAAFRQRKRDLKDGKTIE